ADLLGPNHIGVGFTRSDREDVRWSGHAFTLVFDTHEVDATRQTQIRFRNIVGFDRDGNPVPLEDIEAVTFMITDTEDGEEPDEEDEGDEGDTPGGYDP